MITASVAPRPACRSVPPRGQNQPLHSGVPPPHPQPTFSPTPAQPAGRELAGQTDSLTPSSDPPQPRPTGEGPTPYRTHPCPAATRTPRAPAAGTSKSPCPQADTETAALRTTLAGRQPAPRLAKTQGSLPARWPESPPARAGRYQGTQRYATPSSRAAPGVAYRYSPRAGETAPRFLAEKRPAPRPLQAHPVCNQHRRRPRQTQR